MSNYITSIHINQIFHLKDLDIPMSSEKKQHLLLTGKNGSGKTSLMNAIMEFIEKIYADKNLNFLSFKKQLEDTKQYLEHVRKTDDKSRIAQSEGNLKFVRHQIDSLYGKVDVSMKDLTCLRKDIDEGRFIIAYYNDRRWPNFVEHDQPRKPDRVCR